MVIVDQSCRINKAANDFSCAQTDQMVANDFLVVMEPIRALRHPVPRGWRNATPVYVCYVWEKRR